MHETIHCARDAGLRVQIGLAFMLVLIGCAPRDPGQASLRGGVAKLRRALSLEASTSVSPAFQATLMKAVNLLEQARELMPDNPSVHLNLGVTYWKQHRIADAVAMLEKAAELLPKDPRPYEFLGCVYGSFGLWEDACMALDMANQRRSYSPRILTAMSVAEHQSGHNELALSFLQQAIAADQNYAPALYNMALLQRDECGDSEKAEAYFVQFLASAAEQKRLLRSSPRARAEQQNRIRIAQAFLSQNPAPTAAPVTLRLAPDDSFAEQAKGVAG